MTVAPANLECPFCDHESGALPRPPQNAETRQRRILVIDDQADIRGVVCHTLRKAGFEAIQASNADDGFIAAQSMQPDLILSDITLGSEDGFSLLMRLRGHEVTGTLPVILMTGDADLAGQAGVRHGMELGADDFLKKPFTPEVLLGAVEARLRKQARLRAELERARSCMTRILEITVDVVAIVHAKDGRVAHLNRAGRRLFGLADNQDVSRLSLERLHGESATERLLSEAIPAVVKHGVWQGDTKLRSLEGREIPAREVLLALQADHGAMEFLALVAHDISERVAYEDQLRLLTSALDAAANGVAITDPRGSIFWVNQAFTKLTGFTFEEVQGRNPSVLKSGRHDAAFYREIWETISAGQVWHGEIVNRRKDGACYEEEMTITPVRQGGQITHYIAIKQDVSARRKAEAERSLMEVQLRQAQKLESIGQLAAGIAHEINTPTQFVGDNIRFIQDALQHFQQSILDFQRMLESARGGALTSEMIQEAESALKAADMDYLLRELPTAVRESLEGIERIARIVRAMKEFSHPSSKDRAPINLNHAIESTVTVARNEWKYVAEMALELDPSLPPVRCFASEINQVVLNLIVNAAHAIADIVRLRPGTKGLITVRTRRLLDWAEIQVSDTGTGIPEVIRDRIYDPFFTTKDVGKGTGQGLTIAHDTVVNRHGGSIHFETEMGRGTTFFVQLPLNPRPHEPQTLHGSSA